MALEKLRGKGKTGDGDEPIEPGSKLEADQATGPDDHPGNVSDLSGQPKRAPKRAEKLGKQHGGTLIAEPVEDPTASEKIGPGPGVKPTGKATTHYRYQHVVLPAGPDGDVAPGPETAAITACIAAGYRPVGQASVEGVEDHPDGVSKVVTWSIPCCEAGDPAWREGEPVDEGKAAS
ncbi:MAG: hypothetical protein M3460_04575 [Actinomycetota bacterium]|nr:hypothetical protein [Actinomycetota bacterium]